MDQSAARASGQVRWPVRASTDAAGVYLRQAGDLSNLKAGRTYHLEVDVRGSLLTVLIDGVEILNGNLRFPLAGRQLGFFCQNRKDIHFENFEVKTKKPMAFVVMQLHPPEYEDLFHKVIVPVCEKMGLEAFRASQTFEPGLIIADIPAKDQAVSCSHCRNQSRQRQRLLRGWIRRRNRQAADPRCCRSKSRVTAI